MAREAKGQIPGSVVRAPFYGDNPKGEPVWVTYRAPTQGERRALDAYGLTYSSSDVLDCEGTIKRWHHAIRECVTAVENYNAPGGAPITDGKGLAEHGDDDIVRDVAAAITSLERLSDDAAKKSAGSPASGSGVTRLSSGTATSASAKGGIGSATVPGVDLISSIAQALPG